jgi:hypothetical protein
MLISLQIVLLIENNYKVLEIFQNIYKQYFETLGSTTWINHLDQPLGSTTWINHLDQPLGSTTWIHIFENIFKGSQNTLLYRYREMSDISRNE